MLFKIGSIKAGAGRQQQMTAECPGRGGKGGGANVSPAPLKQEHLRLSVCSVMRGSPASPRAMKQEKTEEPITHYQPERYSKQ